MADIEEFLRDVKRAAIDAVNAQKPFAYMLGEVVSVSPLRIRVSQKLELSRAQLILTARVCEREAVLELDGRTGESDLHTHTIKLEKKIKLNKGLILGERVILLRCDGGQKYIVLDRIGGGET